MNQSTEVLTEISELQCGHCFGRFSSRSVKRHLASCWGRTALAELIADGNPKLKPSWFFEASREDVPDLVLFEVQDGRSLEDVVGFLILHFGLPAPLRMRLSLKLKRKGGKQSQGDVAPELEGPALKVELGKALRDAAGFYVRISHPSRTASFSVKVVRRIRCSDLSQPASLLARSVRGH